jgi:hypothetical protein
MASVSFSSQSSQNLMFEDVAEQLFVHMNLTSEEMQIFALKDRAIDGRYYRVDFQTDGNSYMASRGPGQYQPGYDPSASAEDGFADYSVSEMLFYPRQHFISTDFTGQMKAAVKSKKGGYFNLADFRFKDTAEQMKERVAIKLAGSSLGTIGKIRTAYGGANATVTLEASSYSAASTQTWENGSRYIKRGLRLDATTQTRGAILRNGLTDRGRQVLSVDYSDGATPSIVLNSAPTNWAAGDYLVIYNERQVAAITSATDWNSGTNGLIGILDAVDDGVEFPYYGGLARSSYPTLKAIVTGASSAGVLRPLTQQIINYAIAKKKQISGGSVDVLYSTWDVQRLFVDFLTIQGYGSSGATSNNNPTRFDNPGTSGGKVKIGFNSYEVYPLGASGVVTFMASRHAPHHCAFLLERSTAVLLHDGPPSFIDYDGNTIRKVVGKDEATADWVWRATGFVCREPWKNVRIDDLSGDHNTVS